MRCPRLLSWIPEFQIVCAAHVLTIWIGDRNVISLSESLVGLDASGVGLHHWRMMGTDQGVAAQDVHRVLRDVFGFDRFRPHQADIVAAILSRRDAFIVMPTGGGKSLCYQLPAHLLDGTCIVISPLISLMKDQVDAAVANGLRAAFLNSSLGAGMKRQVEQALAAGALDLLYVSPERFAMPAFLALLRQIPLAFVAVDEAHCISEWGHDFRPDYLALSAIVPQFPAVPVTAFTATATGTVQSDIINRLGLRDPHIVRASFNRPNLFYKVVPKDKPSDQILRFVKAHAGEPGIIYRTTRKSVEQTAAMLARHGIRALPYHAGLDDATRIRNQEAFNTDAVEVVVATIAFGMGIDKSNVRFVMHADLPKNMESYYQETGRAGRDGDPAHCLLLFGYGDIPKIRYFIDRMGEEADPDADQDVAALEAQRRHALKCLNEMIQYATTHACRRKRILNYFGETWPPATHETSLPCCDICVGEVACVDATRDAQIVLSAIARTGQRFGINHIIAVVTGDATERVCRLGHDRIKTFGAGRDRDTRHWRQVLDNLLAQELVAQTEGEYPVLKLMPAAREVLFDGREVHVLKAHVPRAGGRQRGRAAAPPAYEGAGDPALFEALRTVRKTLAAEQGVPPYVIFSDRTLHEMAARMPTSTGGLLAVSGVGNHKLERYGDAILEAIIAFKAEPTTLGGQ